MPAGSSILEYAAMDFNTFVPQSQAYPYFVPAQGAQQYSPPEDQYEPLVSAESLLIRWKEA